MEEGRGGIMATLLTGTAVKDATSVSNPTAEPLQEDDATDHQRRRRDGGCGDTAVVGSGGFGCQVDGFWLQGLGTDRDQQV